MGDKIILDFFSIQNKSKRSCQKASHLDSKGQSTIEFALTLILLMAFMLFYFQLTLVLSFGNYVQYATFMSARAYLSAGPSREDQRTRARDVIVQMLKRSAGQSGVDKFPSIARGVGGDPGGFEVDPPAEFNPTNRDFSWMQGVRYTFRSKLFLIPMAGTGQFGRQEKSSMGPQLNSLVLTSESWLGREPPDDECRNDMGKNAWFFDNGC
jgi:hypothetical protein